MTDEFGKRLPSAVIAYDNTFDAQHDRLFTDYFVLGKRMAYLEEFHHPFMLPDG